MPDPPDCASPKTMWFTCDLAPLGVSRPRLRSRPGVVPHRNDARCQDHSGWLRIWIRLGIGVGAGCWGGRVESDELADGGEVQQPLAGVAGSAAVPGQQVGAGRDGGAGVAAGFQPVVDRGDHAGGRVDGHLDAVPVGRGHRLGAGVDDQLVDAPGDVGSCDRVHRRSRAALVMTR